MNRMNRSTDALGRRLRLSLTPWRLLSTLRWLVGILRSVHRRRREARDGSLTVAVDAASLFEPLTGIGWYLYQLLTHLAQREGLRLRLYGPEILALPGGMTPVVPLPQGPAIEWVRYPGPGPQVVAAGRLIRWVQRLAPLLVAADGNRVLFAPNYLAPPHLRLAAALPPGAALVATVHDLAIDKVPEAVRPDSRRALAERLERTFLDAVALITPSHAVRREIAEAGRFDPARITAIHHGPGQAGDVSEDASPDSADPDSARPEKAAPRNDRPEKTAPEQARSMSATQPLTLPGPSLLEASRPAPESAGNPPRYGLAVGTLEPRKNLLLLLAAWRRLRGRLADAPRLVLVGPYGWKSAELKEEVAAAEREGWLEHRGYVAVEELVRLYREAAVVAFPTVYEGFGLPALEAMACGAPLVASDLAVLREVAGDAALFAPASDPAAWSDALERVLTRPDLAGELRRRGLERARRFSWQRAAEETLEAWRRAGA